MSKKPVKVVLKLQIPAGKATPAPPVGTALGPHGINIMDFCKQFNAQTSQRAGQTVPAEITVYTDRSFSFILKTQPTAELIMKQAKISKGSSSPKDVKVGKITWSAIEEIAKIKMQDLNAFDLEQAKKIIAGSARSMGVDVVDG